MWFTEAHAAWMEAIALILIFVVELRLAFVTLSERREAREERKEAELSRQRSDVFCGGVVFKPVTLNDDEYCLKVWEESFKHAGFAFDKLLYHSVPEYLRRKCEAHMKDIAAPFQQAHGNTRLFFAFVFPYPKYDGVLADIRRLNFGTSCLAWDENGKQIKL
jgi:hypothetical protein